MVGTSGSAGRRCTLPVPSSLTFPAFHGSTTLATLMRSFAPDRIDTQDFSGSGNFDHSDHIYTAYLTRDAHRAYTTVTHTLVGYLDYTIQNQPANVSGTDLTQKQNAFFAYSWQKILQSMQR